MVKALLLLAVHAGAFAVLPQQMKQEVEKAFGRQEEKKEEAPAAPAVDVAALIASSKAAREAADLAERQAAERKARDEAQRKKVLFGGGALAALLVGALVLRKR